MSLIEGEDDLQPVNNVIDEEGEFQQQPEEETERYEELFLEGRSREWEEERSSSSFELRSGSPKSPLVIPDSPNARAYLTLFNSVALPTHCYPVQGLSYTYSRMICSSLSIGALLGSSLFSSALQPLVTTINAESNQQYYTHAYPPRQLPVVYSTSCLASHENHRIVSLILCFTARRVFARSPLVYWKHPPDLPSLNCNPTKRS